MRRFLFIISLLLAGCAGPARQLAAPSLAEAQASATSRQATSIAAANLIVRYGGVYRHEAASRIAGETLADLARASGLDVLPRQVLLLNSPSYNAFALPNGQLFLTRGFLALANDQSELAAALAHELGHVIAKHAARRLVATAEAISDSVKEARDTDDKAKVQAFVQARRQSLAAFSRAQEIEADRIAAELLRKAGYDTKAPLRVLESLERMSLFHERLARVERRAPGALASHPPTPERIAALKASRIAGGEGRTGRDRYLASVSGLAFGEDGSGGYARGRSFIDPGQNIAVTLPPGYLIASGGRGGAVGIKQGGRVAMVFAPAPDSAASDPQGALLRMAGSSAAQSIEQFQTRNIKGAIAVSRNGTAEVRAAVVEAGGISYRVMFSSKLGDPEMEREFSETISSFRSPTAGDIKIARPLSIRVAPVAGGAALRQFASNSGDADNGAALILALNGLRSDAELKPGRALKILELSPE